MIRTGPPPCRCRPASGLAGEQRLLEAALEGALPVAVDRALHLQVGPPEGDEGDLVALDDEAAGEQAAAHRQAEVAAPGELVDQVEDDPPDQGDDRVLGVAVQGRHHVRSESTAPQAPPRGALQARGACPMGLLPPPARPPRERTMTPCDPGCC